MTLYMALRVGGVSPTTVTQLIALIYHTITMEALQKLRV